jgi:hypothetical protein
MDPAQHISVTVKMNTGADMKAHVPTDGNEQQVFQPRSSAWNKAC